MFAKNANIDVVSFFQKIARVHIDTWRTTFAGIVPQDYLDQLTYAESEGFCQN